MRITNLRNLAILATAAGLALGGESDAAGWGKSRSSCPTCPAPCPAIIDSAPATPSEQAAAPAEEGKDGAAPPAAAVAPVPADQDAAALSEAMTGQYDVASASNISAPNMIGDFFGGGGLAIAPSLDGTNDFIYDSNEDIIGLGPDAIVDPVNISPGTGGGVGRIKLAENTSILPQDRAFFGYNFFDSVPLAGNGTDVNRFVPGFEKTFFGGATSVEVRIPFAGTLDSNQNSDALGATNVELGNVTLFLKALFFSSDTLAIGGGLTITTPTASDLVVVDQFNDPVLKIENEGTHLAPYLGIVWMPGRFFSQLYFQYDVDATGRSAFLRGFDSQSQPYFQEYGKFNDTSVAFLDWNVGYWLYQNPNGDSFITGIAPVFEVHYNQALGNGDFITNNQYAIADTNDSFSNVNLTFGSHIVMGQRSILTLAAGLPVTTGADRQFDYEFHVIFNYLFGRSVNAMRYGSASF